MTTCQTCTCGAFQTVSEANSEGQVHCMLCGRAISPVGGEQPTVQVADFTEETRLLDSRKVGVSDEAAVQRHEFEIAGAAETRVSVPVTEQLTRIADPQAKEEDGVMFLPTKLASSLAKERSRSPASSRFGTGGARLTEADLKQPIMVGVGRENLPAAPPQLDNGLYAAHRILREHQKGGMGRILIAYDEFLKRDVALKELHKELVDEPSILQRFIGEAETTAHLEHPGIVPVHTFGLNEGRPYYTMKLIRGQTLQDAIKNYHREPSKAELTNLVRRLANVCKTMAFAHNKGFIHRDLKPANIMLGEHGETLVMDWGLAKSFLHPEEETLPPTAAVQTNEARRAARPELTMVGSVVGTLAFMSPEQATPETGAVGPLSDVFSIGAVLYYLLSGQTAFSGRSSQDILDKVRHSVPTKPSSIKPYVPSDLEAVCLKAMERDPADRYQSADEMFLDLCRWLDNEPVRARKETLLQGTLRRIRRNRRVSLSLSSAMVLIVLLIAVGVVGNQLTQWKTVAGVEDVVLNQSVDLLNQPSVGVEGTGLSFHRETKRKGSLSLQVVILKGDDARLTVTAPAQRTWNLAERQFLSFSMLESDSEGAFPINNFFVRLGKGSAYFEFRPSDDWWSKRNYGIWSTFSIPLDGSAAWMKTAVNDPALDEIQWMELHFETPHPAVFWIDNLLLSRRHND